MAAPVAVAAVAMVIREVVGAMVGARLAEAEAVFVAAVAALVAAGMGDAPGAWRVAQPVVVGRWVAAVVPVARWLVGLVVVLEAVPTAAEPAAV